MLYQMSLIFLHEHKQGLHWTEYFGEISIPVTNYTTVQHDLQHMWVQDMICWMPRRYMMLKTEKEKRQFFGTGTTSFLLGSL